MSEVGFPLKDLTRRKFQTALTMVGLTICTATTVFLIIFGENVGFEIASVTGGKLTIGFSNIFSRFIIMISILNISVGALTTSFLIFLSMSERVQDVGIMKATGCLTSLAFSYFVTELSIIIFVSCVAGTVLGVITHFICVNMLNSLGFSISQKPINIWSVGLIFLVFVIASYILGARPIVKAIRVKPAEALSPLYSLGTTFESSGKPTSSRLGFAFRIAYRGLMRRRTATLRAIICLAAVLTLTTVTVAGGMIASQTTQGYVERAIGKDIVVVGHPDLSRQFVNLLSQFFEAKEIEPVNYFDSKFLIPESLVSSLRATPGVLKVDPRLILEATVYEVQAIIVDPEEPGQYIVIGDHRSGDALVLGIDSEHLINEWMVLGRFLNETDLQSTIIGDSLALEILSSPQKQSVRMFGENFEIAGVCLDPLNKGKVVYVPFKALSALVGQLNYNLLLLKIDPSNRSEVLAEIERQISGTELQCLELNEILGKHLNFLGYVWSFAMFLPLFSLATGPLCLLSYMMLSVTGQQRTFGIMRALGAKSKAVMKVIFTEALIISLVSGAIGISLGFIFTFLFLIPEPLISVHTFASVAGWLLLALGLLCLFSLYPALKTVKKSVASVMSHP